MLLVQLVYASRTDDELTTTALKEILAASQRNNAAVDVTGALMYNSRFFLQCLEGSRAAVNAVYTRILGDPRHQDPALLHYREVDARDFAGWSMGYVGEGVSKREAFLRYGAVGRFDPFALSGGAARGLLLELAKDREQPRRGLSNRDRL